MTIVPYCVWIFNIFLFAFKLLCAYFPSFTIFDIIQIQKVRNDKLTATYETVSVEHVHCEYKKMPDLIFL